MKCQCCKGIIKNPMGSQKYCNSCSLFTKNLREKLSYYKSIAKKLKIEKFGQKNGWERIRIK